MNDDPIAQSDPSAQEPAHGDAEARGDTEPSPGAPEPTPRSRGRVIATVVAAVVRP